MSNRVGIPSFLAHPIPDRSQPVEPLIQCIHLQGWHLALRFVLRVAIQKELWVSECSLTLGLTFQGQPGKLVSTARLLSIRDPGQREHNKTQEQLEEYIPVTSNMTAGVWQLATWP